MLNKIELIKKILVLQISSSVVHHTTLIVLHLEHNMVQVNKPDLDHKTKTCNSVSPNYSLMMSLA